MTPTTTQPETSLYERLSKTLRRATGRQHQPPQLDLKMDTSDVLRLLAPDRRRSVLQYLATNNQPQIDVSDLAEEVASKECDCPRSELTEKDYKRIYVALVQSHLPVLHDSGVVIYDRDFNIVRRGPEFEEIERVQRTITGLLEV